VPRHIIDDNNGAVRKLTNGPAGWQVTTLATGFYHCCGVAVDSSGNVYVADSGHHVIQMITPQRPPQRILRRMAGCSWLVPKETSA